MLCCCRVGLALVQVSVLLHSQLVVTNDDNFVTGILRERLQPEVGDQAGDNTIMLSAQVSILQLGDGLVSAPVWDSLLSTCPVLSWTKNVFGNQFVLEKG